jgi:hypothetical protein
MVSINYQGLIKIVKTVSEKIANLRFGAHLKGPMLGAGMFTLTRLRPEMDKLLHLEHKQNLSVRSGPREGHIHTYMQTDTALHKSHFGVQGGSQNM